MEGNVLKGLEFPANIAKSHSKWNSHQNGDIITTNNNFLFDNRSKDITSELNKINNLA